MYSAECDCVVKKWKCQKKKKIEKKIDQPDYQKCAQAQRQSVGTTINMQCWTHRTVINNNVYLSEEKTPKP